MAKNANTGSQSTLPSNMQTRSKTSGGSKGAQNKSKVTKAKKTKTKGKTLLSHRKDDRNNVTDNKDSTVPTGSSTKQRSISGFLRQTKARVTRKTADKEEVHEHEVKTTVSKRRSTDNKVTTTVRQDTTIETFTSVPTGDSGKKRKHKAGDDDDYLPLGAVNKRQAVTEGSAEIEDAWFTERPRRSARNSASSYADIPSDGYLADVDIEGSTPLGRAASPVQNSEFEGQHDDTLTAFLTLKIPQLATIVDATMTNLPNAVDAIIDIHAKEEEDAGADAEPSPDSGETALTLQNKRPAFRVPEGGWDSAKYRFKFGLSPYPEHESPTAEAAAEVFDILRADLAIRGIVVGPGERGPDSQGPAHGSAKGVTVDALVRTILSQATNNENALLVQASLVNKFPYIVDGKPVRGKMPNYHDMRHTSQELLVSILKPAGIQRKRAEFIRDMLNSVYKANTVDNAEWDGVDAGNAANASDFVPGLLSLDFLNGKTKLELFNWFLDLPGVGVKTVHCILEFNYGFAVCAVDTHVLFMAAALDWIPRDCKAADKAAMHLDARLPDHLKHDLHQAFWNHRQHCGPCKRVGGDKQKPGKRDAARCVLEERLNRRKITADIKRKPAKKGEKTEKVRGKAAKVQFEKMTAEKAAELGYEYSEVEINDDFAAGSVNVKVTQMWVLKSE